MQILILVDDQYLQNVFSIEKGSNDRNHDHSLSDSHHPIQNFIPPPLTKFLIPSLPRNAIWKALKVRENIMNAVLILILIKSQC